MGPVLEPAYEQVGLLASYTHLLKRLQTTAARKEQSLAGLGTAPAVLNRVTGALPEDGLECR